jgi:hypothetical protein
MLPTTHPFSSLEAHNSTLDGNDVQQIVRPQAYMCKGEWGRNLAFE